MLLNTMNPPATYLEKSHHPQDKNGSEKIGSYSGIGECSAQWLLQLLVYTTNLTQAFKAGHYKKLKLEWRPVAKVPNTSLPVPAREYEAKLQGPFVYIRKETYN